MAKKGWLTGVVKKMKKGALHKQLGIPQGRRIPSTKLRSAAKKGGVLGQRARFAERLRSFR